MEGVEAALTTQTIESIANVKGGLNRKFGAFMRKCKINSIIAQAFSIKFSAIFYQTFF